MNERLLLRCTLVNKIGYQIKGKLSTMRMHKKGELPFGAVPRPTLASEFAKQGVFLD